MKKFLVTFLMVSLPALASVTPGTTSATDPNDPFFPYQWSLKSSGQTARRETSDIQATTIHANPNASINWSVALSNRMTRDVVVAVIDSGMDLDHEDLKNHIFKNEKECVDGRIPLNSREDKDHNGLNGDCMGWSFVTAQGSNRFNDKVGHGTFVAGIIAAEINNKIGISGLGSRIKILPIQVYDDAEPRQSASTRPVLTDRIAKAIDYAVSRGAKVINISMGWPGLLNLPKVRKAFEDAESAGVLIVAGAGNDGHNSPVFPCATAGVLCVGAIDMATDIAAFSNYAGAVDLYAPGKNIVSLWPRTEFSFFGPRGYEEKSGTSFSAPYVAGAAALLMGIYPNESAQQIRTRLISQARIVTNPSKKPLPLLNVMAASQAGASVAVHPEFKSEDIIQVNPSTLRFSMTLKIQNSGPARSISVEVSSPSHPGALASSRLNPSLRPGLNEIVIPGRLSSRNQSSFLQLRVRIGNRTYENFRTLVLDLRSRARVFNLPTNKTLLTVPTFPIANEFSEYFYSEKVAGSDLKLSVLRLSTNGQTTKSEASIPQAAVLLNTTFFPIQKVDINLDGRQDYIVFSVVNDSSGSAESLQVSYFDQDLKPLFTNSVGMKISLPDFIPHLSRVSYIISQTSRGRQRIPLFWASGTIPKADANPNPFDFEENGTETRLYALDGAEVRLITNHAFTSQLTALKKIVFPDELSYHGIVSQSVDLFERGEAHLLASVGQGVNRAYFTIQILGSAAVIQPSQLRAVDMGGRDLQLQNLVSTSEFQQSKGEDVGFSVAGLFSNALARVLNFTSGPNGLRLAQDVRIQMPDESDSLNSIVQSFSANGKSSIAIATDNKIGFYDVSTRRLKQNLIFRYTYLPGKLLAPRYVPLYSNRANSATPGLYVDNSLWFMPQAIVWGLNSQGEMDVQTNHSLFVPEGCKSLNPTRYQNDSVFALQCQSRLHLIPIE